jgi:CRP-like cAMP-binding protein
MLLKGRAEKIDALKGVPLLSSLSRQHLSLISRYADEVAVEAGRVLAREGGVGQEFFLVLEGRARVERNGRPIARLGKGAMFGEVSLIDQQPRSASVISESPMTLLVVSARSFGALLDDVPPLRRKVMVALCERLRAADAKLAARN